MMKAALISAPNTELRSGADIVLATSPAAEPMIAAFPGPALNRTMIAFASMRHSLHPVASSSLGAYATGRGKMQDNVEVLSRSSKRAHHTSPSHNELHRADSNVIRRGAQNA